GAQPAERYFGGRRGLPESPESNDRNFFFQAEDGIRDGQFHPAGIVFVLLRHLSDGAFFQY
ncbi:hypothetical protein AB3W65_001840, partial [Neisseria gonorrhoeae]